MINTKELMLGNLVEYYQQYAIVTSISKGHVDLKINEKYYRGTHCSNINPIELTDDIKRKLGFMTPNTSKYLHMVQNYRTSLGYTPLDITQLLRPKPILTTHDGVEVISEDAIVFVTFQDATSTYHIETKSRPVGIKLSTYLKGTYPKLTVIFSTESACQSYINQKWAELHPEPIFVTEDGVGIYKGMKYCYCLKNGYRGYGTKCTVVNCSPATFDSGSREDVKYFSTEAIAQAYLNKVWADAEYQSLLKATSK